MKKIIALILALMIVASMAGCSQPVETPTTEPTVTEAPPTTEPIVEETEAPTEAPTELPAPPVPTVEELLQTDDVQTVKMDTIKQYIDKLNSLGFTEFTAPERNIDNVNTCLPVSLTYNNQAFKLEFSYLGCVFDVNASYSEAIEPDRVDGWVLYGTKSDSSQNVSEIKFDDYQYVDTLEDLPGRVTDVTKSQEYFPQKYQNSCYNLDADGNITDWVYHASAYFPVSGNLYNFVHIAESPRAVSMDTPRILVDWDDYLMRYWKAQKLKTFRLGIVGAGMRWTTDKLTCRNEYYYEAGMTPYEWAESEYNIDGWYLDPEYDVLRYWTNEYVMLPTYDKENNPIPCDKYTWSGIHVMTSETFQSEINQEAE